MRARFKRHSEILSLLFVLTTGFFWAFWLWPEATYRGYECNDLGNHHSYIRLLLDHFSRGSLGLDAWDDQTGFGFPIFRIYQNMPHLFAAALSYFGGLDSKAVMRVLLVLALAFQGISFFVAGKLAGLDRTESIAVAVLAPLVSSRLPLGHEFRSYTFSGIGLFTQALGLPFFLLGLGAIARWRNWANIGFLTGLTYLFHQFYGAFLIIVIACVIFAQLIRRQFQVKALLIIISSFLLLTSYHLLSLGQDQWLTHKNLMDYAERWNGYPIGTILENLFLGRLFDYERLPFVTPFVAFGILSILWKSPQYRFFVFVFLGSLVGMAGGFIPTEIKDKIPLLSGFPMERFLGVVHISGIFLAGIGLVFVLRWRRASPAWYSLVILLAFGICACVYDRVALIGIGTDQMKTQSVLATQVDPDWWKEVRRVTGAGNFLGQKPGGSPLRMGYTRVDDAAIDEGLRVLSANKNALSYVSYTPFLMSVENPEHFRLLNITSLLMKQKDPAPHFWKPVGSFNDMRLYQIESGLPVDLIQVQEVRYVDGMAFLNETAQWLKEMEPGKPVRWGSLMPEKVSRHAPDSLPQIMPASAASLGTVLSYKYHRADLVEASFEAKEKNVLGLYRQAYHPLWKILVNGNQVDPKWAGPGFLAFPLEQGKNQVTIEFPEDPWRRRLFFLSLAGILFFLINACLNLRRSFQGTL
jgi:hypothetical protein